MPTNKNSFFDQNWKRLLGATALIGTLAVAALFSANSGTSPSNEASASITFPAVADEAVEEPVAYEPAPEVTQYAPDEAAMSDERTSYVGRAFALYSTNKQQGFWKDSYGECYYAFGYTPQEMTENLEAKVGMRVKGYDWFKDGIIVNFKNGARIPVWSKEIDCKDPQYNPLRGETDEAVLESGSETD